MDDFAKLLNFKVKDDNQKFEFTFTIRHRQHYYIDIDSSVFPKDFDIEKIPNKNKFLDFREVYYACNYIIANFLITER
jgi:hypothetical protein